MTYHNQGLVQHGKHRLGLVRCGTERFGKVVLNMTQNYSHYNQGGERHGWVRRCMARLGAICQGNVRVPGYEQKLPTLQSGRGMATHGEVIPGQVWQSTVRTILSMILNCLFTVKVSQGVVRSRGARCGMAW